MGTGMGTGMGTAMGNPTHGSQKMQERSTNTVTLAIRLLLLTHIPRVNSQEQEHGAWNENSCATEECC